MKKVITLILFTFTLHFQLHAQDTTTLARTQYVKTFTSKSDSLNQIALKLAVPGASPHDLNLAIEYIMKGLHTYSKFRDSVGLRETFDHLSLVYRLQKKMIQAKWFAIQSNTMARDMKDTLNIIHSLMSLASVKTDIKDYELAYRDLNEAKYLAKTHPGIQQQIEVQKALADYYSKKGDADEAVLATNRIQFLTDSVSKADQAKILQGQRQSDSIKLVNKQPLVTSNIQQTKVADKPINTLITYSVIGILLLVMLLYYIIQKRKRF